MTNKKALYESIMKTVSVEVKKAINEFYATGWEEPEMRKEKRDILEVARPVVVELVKRGDISRAMMAKMLVSNKCADAVAEMVVDELEKQNKLCGLTREKAILRLAQQPERLAVGSALKALTK